MAGLIPQAFIDDLLARADIVDVVGNKVTLRKTGKNYSGLCPFHQEKSPSFSVEPNKQFYYCFGCGAGGNAIGFIMNFESLEFPQAIESLARHMGVEVPYEENPQQHKQRARKQTLYDLMEKTAQFYQQQLQQHPDKNKAIEYLKSRGLSGEICRDFGLGLAPAGWDNLLKALGNTEEQSKMLLEGGMTIEKENPKNSFYDRFRERIMYPIRDSRGRVIAFGGRVLGDDKPKYLNSPETPIFSKGRELYGLYEARQKVRNLERLLIVEGYMDVIALAQLGVPYSVATLGTATSTDHLQRIFKLVPEVVFCFDGDSAGRKAAWRALEQALPLMKDGLTARFLFLPDGEDPDTQIRKVGKQAFEQSIKDSKQLAEYFFEALGEQVDMQSLEGRARLGSLAMPLINQVPEGIYRQLIIEQLSSLTGADASTLQSFSKPHATERTSTPAPAAPPRREQNRFSPPAPPRMKDPKLSASLKAVNLILLDPGIVAQTNHDGLDDIQAPDIILLKQVVAIARQNPGSDTPQLLGRLYATPEGSKLIQLANKEQITPPEGMADEYAELIHGLVKRQQKRSKVHALLEEARQKLNSKLSEN